LFEYIEININRYICKEIKKWNCFWRWFTSKKFQYFISTFWNYWRFRWICFYWINKL